MKIYFCFLILIFNASILISKECDNELSNKPFNNYNFKELTHIFSLSGKTICNSSFYNEKLDSDIFPSTMTGVTFIGCNLDNVKIPEGNNLIDCSTRRISEQNDGGLWVLDKLDDPQYPVNKELYELLNISIDPKKIPLEKLSEPIISLKSKESVIVNEISDKQKELDKIRNETSKTAQSNPVSPIVEAPQ